MNGCASAFFCNNWFYIRLLHKFGGTRSKTQPHEHSQMYHLESLAVFSSSSKGEPLNSCPERGTCWARSHKKPQVIIVINDIFVTTNTSNFFQHGVPDNGLGA